MIYSQEQEDLDMADLERYGVWELQVYKELYVASSYESAYGDPVPNVSNFVNLMIHVSSYFLSHYFGILCKV